ncbi:methylated-DNA--[protein]-cysteine S-methyltransferase [Lactobacillus porci]|uniref:methylated-DNA--[protein]-cysteine S-methyltransferase n=1 Tax=Lactobacillus porci TaxID=2012477 RepID=UPI0039965A72
MLASICYQTPLGNMRLRGDESGLVSAEFTTEASATASSKYPPELPLPLKDAVVWLDAYFQEGRQLKRPLLKASGTAFQTAVWNQLLQLPYGQTATYRDLALQLGSAPRAVGGAVGRNPLALFIPCHRILGSRGQLTGYAWGLDRKQWLLNHERSALVISLS